MFTRKHLLIGLISACGLGGGALLAYTIFLHTTVNPCHLIKERLLSEIAPTGLKPTNCEATKLEEVQGVNNRREYAWGVTLEARASRDLCASETQRLCGVVRRSQEAFSPDFKTKFLKEKNCLAEGTDACAYPDKKVALARGGSLRQYFRVRLARAGIGPWTLLQAERR